VSHNITAQEYHNSYPFESESQLFTGFIKDNEPIYPNSFSWKEGKSYYNQPDKSQRLVDYENSIWNVRPQNTHQNLAMELLLNDNVKLLTIQSKAGYGKSYLALATAMQKTVQEKIYNKIYLVKPTIEIGEGLGFLPGTLEEKVDPYVRYLRSLVLKLHQLRGSKCGRIFTDDSTPQKLKLNPELFEVLPINYIRGMNIENAFVIVDECQNLSRIETRALLTRMGHGTKCICLGDVEQIDNHYLNKYNNGMNWIVKSCLGEKFYGHIVLKGDRSRGPICDMILRNNL